MEGSHLEPRDGAGVTRLVLVTTSLQSGGAERVMSTLAGHWAARGRRVTLITLSSRRGDFYALDSRVERVALDVLGESGGLWDAVAGNARRVAALRRAVRTASPDLVIAFGVTINLLVLLATRGLRLPVVVSERTDPRYAQVPGPWRRLRRLLYPRADALVVQSEELREWATEEFGFGRIYTVPNPVVAPSGPPAQPCAAHGGPRTLAAMGRLVPVKGHDLLLLAFARAVAAHPEWALVIYGEGPERGRLEAMVRELGIAGRVTLPGRVEGPGEALRQAHLFALTSRYEGFPNALLEAMAAGLPVVSFDCPSGPRAIIRDGIDGVLVPPGDVEALAKALCGLMSDGQERARLGAAARQVTERFSLERVMGMWEQTIASACARSAR